MTIKLSQTEENDLIVKLAQEFESRPLRNEYIGPDDFSWADEITPNFQEDTRTKIDRFLGEKGLSQFIYSEIKWSADLSTDGLMAKRGQPITQFDFARSPISLARNIVNVLKQIPIRYRITAQLPIQFSAPLIGEVQEKFDLQSDIWVTTGGSLPGGFAVTSNNIRIDRRLFNDFIIDENINRDLAEDRFYFSMPVLGYASYWPSTDLGRTFEDGIRAFYGAAFAIKLIDYGWGHDGETLPFMMIHTPDCQEIINTEKLEDDLLERSFHTSTVAFAKDHKDDLWQAYQIAMKDIGTIFGDSVDRRKLFTACIWYYRAMINRRRLDALLEATIAIEVILGDKKASEGIAISNLLGSRCAFLLGTSTASRDTIMAVFRKIYDLRSQIVHEGRHTLQAGDRHTVNSALTLCGRIIAKELKIRAKSDA